jgi:hypothetical protein
MKQVTVSLVGAELSGLILLSKPSKVPTPSSIFYTIFNPLAYISSEFI